jgi:DNA-binding XRE family transcriptional regulator
MKEKIDIKFFPPDPINTWPCHRIRRCRKYLSVSQNELARRLGISQPTIAKLEKNLLSSKKYAEQLEIWWSKEKQIILTGLASEVDFINSL